MSPNPEVEGEEYKLKTLDNQGRPFEVTTNSQGQVWLIVGTDSGFEGLSGFYYAEVNYTLTALEPPSAGDFAPSSWLVVGMALLGVILAALGSLVFVGRRKNKSVP